MIICFSKVIAHTYYTYPIAYTQIPVTLYTSNASYAASGIFGTYNATITGCYTKNVTFNGVHYDELGCMLVIGF